MSRSKAMKSTLVSLRTFPPESSEGWTIHFIEQESRYWVAAQAGRKETGLFEQGTQRAWNWAKPAQFIRWFTDGERRYGRALWKLASIYLKRGEAHRHYHHRKVWREGLEVAMKIKGSQGQRRVEWVYTEHPFTAVSAASEVHANHNEAQNSALRRRCSAAKSGGVFPPRFIALLIADDRISMPSESRHYNEHWMCNDWCITGFVPIGA